MNFFQFRIFLKENNLRWTPKKKKVGSVSTTLPRMKQGGPFLAQNQKTGKPLPLLAGQLVLVELLDEGHQGLEVGGYGLAVRMA